MWGKLQENRIATFIGNVVFEFPMIAFLSYLHITEFLMLVPQVSINNNDIITYSV